MALLLAIESHTHIQVCEAWLLFQILPLFLWGPSEFIPLFNAYLVDVFNNGLLEWHQW